MKNYNMRDGQDAGLQQQKNINFGGFAGVHYPQTSMQKEAYRFERTFQQLLISSLLGVGIDRYILMQTCTLLNSVGPDSYNLSF